MHYTSYDKGLLMYSWKTLYLFFRRMLCLVICILIAYLSYPVVNNLLSTKQVQLLL